MNTLPPASTHSTGLTHGAAVGLMVLVTLMWSTAGVVTRQLESAQSFEVTFWRSAFTAVALAVWWCITQGGHSLGQRVRTGGAVLWASAACWATMFTAFMVALTLTTVGNVLVTMALGPLVTALVAKLWLNTHIPKRTWWAIVTAGAGIGYMFWQQAQAGVSLLGSVVALAVPVAGAINWSLIQRQQHPASSTPSGPNGEPKAPVDLSTAVMLGGVLSAAFALPLAWPFQASMHDVLWLASLGVGQLAIPCVLSLLAAQKLAAPEVALLALLEVIFGTLLAWWGANETPGTDVLLGGGLVMTALTVNEWLGWQSRQKPPTA